jgi:circadian clock protein KaiB
MAKPGSRNAGPQRTGYVLRLYICGATARSHRAVNNIKEICEDKLKGQYDLQVIDIFQSPEQVKQEDIVAAPTLVKKQPLPIRRFIGDLSDKEKVVKGLAINE